MRCFLHFSKELSFNYIATSIWMITCEQLLWEQTDNMAIKYIFQEKNKIISKKFIFYHSYEI